MPDYHLYDEWIKNEVIKARQEAERTGEKFDEKRFMRQFKGYTDYSIGFMTRGCFRKCEFCVNKKYEKVYLSVSGFAAGCLLCSMRQLWKSRPAGYHCHS